MTLRALLFALLALCGCTEVASSSLGDDKSEDTILFEECMSLDDAGRFDTAATFLCICFPNVSSSQEILQQLQSDRCVRNQLDVACPIGNCIANIDQLRAERARAMDAGSPRDN